VKEEGVLLLLLVLVAVVGCNACGFFGCIFRLRGGLSARQQRRSFFSFVLLVLLLQSTIEPTTTDWGRESCGSANGRDLTVLRTGL
jgi:hypothetical protein